MAYLEKLLTYSVFLASILCGSACGQSKSSASQSNTTEAQSKSSPAQSELPELQFEELADQLNDIADDNTVMEISNYPKRDYLTVFKHDDGSVSICFSIENDIILALGEEMNEIREEAYMNGYNWDAFLNYYLAVNAPDILAGLERDPEAGMYIAEYVDGAANEGKARRFAEIIVSLVENKEKIFKILRDNGDKIAWD